MERVKAELTEMIDSAENSLRADSAATIEHRTRAALAGNLIGERRAGLRQRRWLGLPFSVARSSYALHLLALHLPARGCCLPARLPAACLDRTS